MPVENGTKESLTILRMPEGGFIVTDGFMREEFAFRSWLFASSTLDEALKFIKAKVSLAK